ncbi:elongation factor G [Clostridium beijerinckii]|jgi:translation elongation factor 2 (EF-2/EF-G)|uniref:Elongation factor G n=2 Tax=Clostridium beijerinckii TaxID=1520 RepID=A0AAE2RRQ4_CLOBE|nr:elongation factor G [Clostridium beijerinckii]ABR37003.1 translation elongation factor G [Clostridium beijerinckii NCIMB 8052]AIU00276.1 elongation factor G [Clostridium beijerinckii ATCC 35702]MBF7808349.1 elongation factor G [Clostridium beijerinckii]MCI1478562.1 elongation factor G [Clostridium beijerinckii]MCI1579451.1 elongation factor G [Clostridium beijerinckii]
MKDYSIKNLRNVGLMGHNGTGKTSLAESLLYYSKITDRLGNIEDGTTVLDFDTEEKKRQFSIALSVAPIELDNVKINLIDIPGYADFQGECIEGMRAVDVGMIVVSGVSGVKAGTERAWEYCNKIKLPRTFFINKLDRENSDFNKVLASLKEKFGISVVPIQYPIGEEDNFKGVINIISKQARVYDVKTKEIKILDIPEELQDEVENCKKMIMEAVAETDEVLLDKYFSEGELSDEEIYKGLISGCASGDIAPVMCGSATKVIGMDSLIDDIVECFPSPEYAIPQKAVDVLKDEEVFVNLNQDKPFSALVFKTIADPFVGRISFFRVITGEAKDDMTVLNVNKDKNEKLSHICFIRGKTQIPAKRIIAGDIGAISKLQYTNTGDTLASSDFKVIYDKMNFPKTVFSMAVIPQAKGDEEKISQALAKLKDEDPVFQIDRDVENAEIVISGLGETHINVIASKIKSKFGVDTVLSLPKVPYKETIRGFSDVQGKHKKQSGGHGQYGDVVIKFERRTDGEEELEFIDNVVGGAVPRNFIPAVEKGLRECITHGVLAGCPVIGLKATLHDGSYHSVDSSEMAFKVAASIAYKKGLEQAKPILLEPIMKVEVILPNEYMGDVIADINKKRGRVIGMEPEGDKQRVISEIPLAEIRKYATELRSLTQGRGVFTKEFVRYEEVPEIEVAKAIESINELRK